MNLCSRFRRRALKLPTPPGLQLPELRARRLDPVLRRQLRARDVSGWEIPSRGHAEASCGVSLVADKAWQAFQQEPCTLGSANALSLSAICVLVKARASGRERERPARCGLLWGPSLTEEPRDSLRAARLGFAVSLRRRDATCEWERGIYVPSMYWMVTGTPVCLPSLKFTSYTKATVSIYKLWEK